MLTPTEMNDLTRANMANTAQHYANMPSAQNNINAACYCSDACRQLGCCPNQPNRLGFAGLPQPHDGKGYTVRASWNPPIREIRWNYPVEMTASDLGIIDQNLDDKIGMDL